MEGEACSKLRSSPCLIRVFAGQREDVSGSIIRDIVGQHGYQVVHYRILPDDRDLIADELKRICDGHLADLILTTGGTGFSPRDWTPEATMDVSERVAPGDFRSPALFEHKQNEARDALPRGIRHPWTDVDHQPARQPQGCARKS